MSLSFVNIDDVGHRSRAGRRRYKLVQSVD
jgi:hypothetical protein